MPTNQQTLPKRDEIHIDMRWNLEDLFRSDEDWETEFQLISKKLHEIERFKNRLHTNGNEILRCLRLSDELSLRVERFLRRPIS